MGNINKFFAGLRFNKLILELIFKFLISTMVALKLDVEKFIKNNNFYLWRLKMGFISASSLEEALGEALLSKKTRKISNGDLPNVMDRARNAIALSLRDSVLREVGS